MGAYLSEPVTEKISKDEHSDRLSYGASSMQGWRVSQEDAHNCIIDFDDNTSFFAVYDGHGGAEVAKYCSMNLPDCLRSMSEYKKGNLSQALEDCFMEFDDALTKPEVISEMKQMAGLPDSDDEESEEDARALQEEASLPLDEVLARYETTAIKKVAPHVTDYEKPKSPMLRGKKNLPNESLNGIPLCPVGEAGDDAPVKENKMDVPPVNGEIEIKENIKNLKSTKSDKKETHPSKDKAEENGAQTEKSSEEQPPGDSSKEKSETKSKDSSSKDNDLIQAGCSSGSGSKKRKGRKGKYVVTPKTKEDDQVDGAEKSKAITKASSDDDDDSEEEEEDEEYSAEHSSSDDDDVPGSDDDDDSEDESESEDEEMCDTDYNNSEEEPGADSGCTAVVALLKGDQLYVANAGDSRCVVSRKGVAVNMSFDHKPEDQLESDRIHKAGGRITEGRVNGGLNLSRALGDHAYKINTELPPKEQMVTALPDIQTLAINPQEDEFMILACDGIWNFMSSQEVVDFVNERLKKDQKLSAICEEMFTHCLASDTTGDGTGCDNMTAIIITFHDLKVQNSKRQLESSDISQDDSEAKKLKADPSPE